MRRVALALLVACSKPSAPPPATPIGNAIVHEKLVLPVADASATLAIDTQRATIFVGADDKLTIAASFDGQKKPIDLRTLDQIVHESVALDRPLAQYVPELASEPELKPVATD